jgi:hypothetical protein
MRYLMMLVLSLAVFVGKGQDTTMILVTGGENDEEAITVLETESGPWFIANTGSFGQGSSDVYLFTLDSTNSIQHSVTFGSTTEDKAIGAITFNNGPMIYGFQNTFNDPTYKYFIAFFDANGILTDSISFQMEYDNYSLNVETWNDTVYAIFQHRFNLENVTVVKYSQSQKSSQNIAFCGNCEISDYQIVLGKHYFLTAYDLDTSQLTSIISFEYDFQDSIMNSFSGEGSYSPVSLLNDSAHLYVVGEYLKDSTATGFDVFFQKFDFSLNQIWESFYVGPADDHVSSALINDNNEICFLGWTFSYGIEGDFGFGRFRTTNGSYLDFRTLGSPKLDVGFSLIQSDSSGYWFFGNTIGFESSFTDLLIYRTNLQGITLSNNYQRIVDQAAEQVLNVSYLEGFNADISVYPLPAEKGVNIMVESEIEIESYTIYSLEGVVLLSENLLPSNRILINSERLNSGVNLVQIFFTDKSSVITKVLCIR